MSESVGRSERFGAWGDEQVTCSVDLQVNDKRFQSFGNSLRIPCGSKIILEIPSLESASNVAMDRRHTDY